MDSDPDNSPPVCSAGSALWHRASARRPSPPPDPRRDGSSAASLPREPRPLGPLPYPARRLWYPEESATLADPAVADPPKATTSDSAILPDRERSTAGGLDTDLDSGPGRVAGSSRPSGSAPACRDAPATAASRVPAAKVSKYGESDLRPSSPSGARRRADRASAGARSWRESGRHRPPTIHDGTPSAFVRTCGPGWSLQSPRLPRRAGWHRTPASRRSRARGDAPPPLQFPYPAWQFVGSVYANHIQ